ncbi:MAG: hypothetical protein Kow0010_19240 [Dehalococcoidia bacterium]
MAPVDYQFNVAQLLRDPVGSERRFVLNGTELAEPGWLSLTRIPGGVLARARLLLRTTAACSRCLREFATTTTVAFEEVYYQRVDVVTGEQLERPDDPDAFLVSTVHTVDISEAVRQYTEMAAAMQPLCRPDCPGLCPVCGQDLQAGDCGCDREATDPRWAALAALKLD